MGSYYLMATEFPFEMMKKLWKWWCCLHNSVNALSATELYAYSGEF